MSTIKTSNRDLLKIGLGAIIFSTLLTAIALIIALTPTPDIVKGSIQIAVFVSCVIGTGILHFSNHKKFIFALFIYIILLVIAILLVALNLNLTTLLSLQLCLYLFDAVAKLLILLGFREINNTYNKNENVNRIFIFICLVFAIIRIVFHIIVFALPPEKEASINSINNVINAVGILSESFFFVVIAITYNAVNHHKEIQ